MELQNHKISKTFFPTPSDRTRGASVIPLPEDQVDCGDRGAARPIVALPDLDSNYLGGDNSIRDKRDCQIFVPTQQFSQILSLLLHTLFRSSIQLCFAASSAMPCCCVFAEHERTEL